MEAPETQGKRTVFKILVSSCVFLCAESQNMQLYLTCSFHGNGREDLCRLKYRQKKYERGARIADRRKALGLSQDELAHRIGIGRQSLSAIENGGSFMHRRLTAWLWSLRYPQTLSCMEQEVQRLSSLQMQMSC